MERVTSTDERLDDLSRRMDAGFDRVDRDLRDVRGEIAELRSLIYRFGTGTIATIVVATLLHGI
jgi:hypothetical protein